MSTPKAVLKALTARDGHVCGWCGSDNETLVPQHRAGRGMGGRKSMDRLSNLIWLCAQENTDVESDASIAAAARLAGIKISSFTENPADIPITHAVHGRCLLTDEGTVETGLHVF